MEEMEGKKGIRDTHGQNVKSDVAKEIEKEK